MPLDPGTTAGILGALSEYDRQTWGFTIYRTCYYSDNARWERLLGRLKEFAALNLLDEDTEDEDTEAHENVIWDKLEWDIQEDPSLENCSKEEIWQRHRKLMISRYGEYESTYPHHAFPIIVDQEALDSVLEGTPPAEWSAKDWRISNAYVIALDMNWFEYRLNHLDEEEDEDDKFGWKKILVRKVYPRLYLCCIGDRWHLLRDQPPAIVRDL